MLSRGTWHGMTAKPERAYVHLTPPETNKNVLFPYMSPEKGKKEPKIAERKAPISHTSGACAVAGNAWMGTAHPQHRLSSLSNDGAWPGEPVS
jgi:hypothetical protein